MPLHLGQIGLNNVQIGAVATATLLGSAALTPIAGTLKGVYDLLLLWRFRALRPPEER